MKATFLRRDKPAGLAGSVTVSHVAPAAPKRTTLAAEYRERILDALAPGPLTCSALASVCDCQTGDRSFIRARQRLTAEGTIIATGQSKARIFALPAAAEAA